MPIKDDDFEIIEETISDFEFFYNEDESSKRNRSVIIKYRLMSVLISVVVGVFLLTVLGVSRMKAYGTNNVLTKDEMVYIESKKELEEIFDTATAFFTYDSNYGIDTSCRYAYIVHEIENNGHKYDNNSFYDACLNEWVVTLEELLVSLEEVENPKKVDFSDYIQSLNYFINEEISMMKTIEMNYADIISGNVSMEEKELSLVVAYSELATWYNVINN